MTNEEKYKELFNIYLKAKEDVRSFSIKHSIDFNVKLEFSKKEIELDSKLELMYEDKLKNDLKKEHERRIINHLLNNKRYCPDIENVENYDKAAKDDFCNWVLHHRKEIELHKTSKELKEMGLYYHRPSEELIYLTNKEHGILHKYGNINGETFI